MVSVQGDTERALTLLAEAATICRDMELAGALAYNHKMRGNILSARPVTKRPAPSTHGPCVNSAI